jgi:NADPH-dependent F420 reductase
MKIAIIGSGNIGEGLARAWRKKKHDVAFGARDPKGQEVTALAQEIGASVATVKDAAAGADVVVLAMPYAAVDDVLVQAKLDGKIVVDATNAVQRGPDGMSLKLEHGTSASEELQKRIPGAKVVKSFNAQGAENLAAPVYDGTAASNFYCGDDAAAKKVVHGLVEDVGFHAVDAGPLKSARLLEPLMLLWIACAGTQGSRDIAFRLLKR